MGTPAAPEGERTTAGATRYGIRALRDHLLDSLSLLEAMEAIIERCGAEEVTDGFELMS